MDIVTPAIRSRMMSGIKSTNTLPERLIRAHLHRRGFRFRLHAKNLPGKPDLVLPRYHAVIFVHGCFWHGHGCHLFKKPATRAEFWINKITRNHERDIRNRKKLLDAGLRVGIVWECAIRGADKNIDAVSARIAHWLVSGKEKILEIY